MSEQLRTNATQISQLLDELDEKYPGFKKLFMPPEYDELLNVRTSIYLKRNGDAPLSINEPTFTVQDGDTYFLW